MFVFCFFFYLKKSFLKIKGLFIINNKKLSVFKKEVEVTWRNRWSNKKTKINNPESKSTKSTKRKNYCAMIQNKQNFSKREKEKKMVEKQKKKKKEPLKKPTF